MSAAPPTPGGYFTCGATNQIAGHTWAIRAVGVSCASARTVVRQLARKTVPAGVQKLNRFPGTYGGMRCLGGPSGSKPKSITCAKIAGVGVLVAARLK